jgi:hypothetical protein
MISSGDPLVAGRSAQVMIKSLAEEHPGLLDKLISEEPSGARKREMEDAAFDHLLETDIDAALSRASSFESPRAGVDGMAKVALRLARAEPERAFEVAEKLFNQFPNALFAETSTTFPDGSSTSNFQQSEGATSLLHKLVDRDPELVMSILPPIDLESPGRSHHSARSEAMQQWAGLDPSAARRWLDSAGLPEAERRELASYLDDKQ